MPYQVQYLNRLDQHGRASFTVMITDDEGIMAPVREEFVEFPLPVTESDLEARAELLVERTVVQWNEAKAPDPEPEP